MGVSTQGGNAGAYPANVEFTHRKWGNLSATQLLWAKLERTAARVAMVRGLSTSNNPADLVILTQCETRLDMARDRIDRRFRQSWAFWELVHRVDEQLLLVAPEDMLYAEATDVLAKFDRQIKDPAVRKAWLGSDDVSGPLPKVIERLGHAAPLDGGPLHVLRPRDRNILRGALNLVNEQGDTSFWRLGSNVSVQSLSALLLILLLGVAFLRGGEFLPDALAFLRAGELRPDDLDILMLGAAGAILANMISTRSFIISIGPTSRYFVHSLLVKPVVGASAAALVHLLQKAGLVLAALAPSDSSGTGQLAVDPASQAFVRSIVALAAGFAGEWLLRPMMERVLRAISAQSEKVTTSVQSEKG